MARKMNAVCQKKVRSDSVSGCECRSCFPKNFPQIMLFLDKKVKIVLLRISIKFPASRIWGNREKTGSGKPKLPEPIPVQAGRQTLDKNPHPPARDKYPNVLQTVRLFSRLLQAGFFSGAALSAAGQKTTAQIATASFLFYDNPEKKASI